MSCFQIGTTLVYANATAVFQAGLKHISTVAAKTNCCSIDCSPLTQFDSSALAVLLAWHRAASTKDIALKVLHLPAKLASLAHVYGIDRLMT